MKKKSQHIRDIELKKEIISYSESNPKQSHREISDYFKLHKSITVPKSTIGHYIRNKEKILESAETGINWKRDSMIQQIEEDLTDWIRKAESDNVPMNTEVIRIKALEISLSYGYNRCKFSNGWFQGFKKRHNIGMVKCYGDSKRVDLSEYKDAVDLIKAEIKKYHPNDIYNLDESALFYQLIPSKSFGTQNFKGFGQIKKRVTICFGVNATGKHRLKSLVIGTAKSPRCFKQFTNTNIIDYCSNDSAWMTSKVFGDYIKQLDKKI